MMARIGILKMKGWVNMRCKFNVALQLEDENTGEMIRNFKADIYLNASDCCSMDYLKECIISACENAVNIVSDS